MATGKVLCLGDGIVKGLDSTPGGYRTFRGTLQTLLSSAQFTLDFVGPESDAAASGGADADHAGFAGASIDSGSNHLTSRLAAIKTAVGAVDVIVIYAGWQDVLSFPTSLASRFETFVGAVQSTTWSSAKVVLCTLHPAPGTTEAQTGGTYSAYAALNTKVRELCAASPTTRILADCAALSGASQSQLAEALIAGAQRSRDIQTIANGATLPNWFAGHRVTSFDGLNAFASQWTATPPFPGQAPGDAGKEPQSSGPGHPRFRDNVAAVVPWFWTFALPGHNAPNTVIEVRNVGVQGWHRSSGWRFFFQGARLGLVGGNAKRTPFGSGGTDTFANSGHRGDGVTSWVRPSGGTGIEAWPEDTVPSRGVIGFNGGFDRDLMANSLCFAGLAQARLALLDPSGADDRPNARLGVTMGCDFATSIGGRHYDWLGWPYNVMDGGSDPWFRLTSTDWTLVSFLTLGAGGGFAPGQGHTADPGTPPPLSNYAYDTPYNDAPAYSRTASQIRATPPLVPSYWEGTGSSGSGYATVDYWVNSTSGVRDTNLYQSGADKLAGVMSRAMIASGILAGFTTGGGSGGGGGGPVVSNPLQGLATRPNVFAKTVTGTANVDQKDHGAIATGITWQTSSLPAGTVGVPWSAQFVATGASSYSHVSGKPAWMSIPTNGLASGTPNTAGTYAITVAASNAAIAAAANRAARLVIKQAQWSSKIATKYANVFAPNQGTVYYIDPTLGSGGSGTLGSPYGAMPSLVSGNTYLIKEGTSISAPTISVTNVLIGTYEIGSGSRVYGTTNRSRWATLLMNGDRFGAQLTSTGGIKFSGLRITQNGSPHSADTTLAIYASNASGCSNNVIEYCWLDGVVPHASQITASGGIYMRGVNNVVRFNWIEGSPLDAIYIWGNGSNGPAGARVYGNYVHHPSGYTVDGPDCIQIAPSNGALGRIEIVDNFLRHDSNCKQGIMCNSGTSGDSVLVKDNVVFGPTQSVLPPSGATKGKSILIEQADSRIEGNYIEGADWGIGVSGDNTEVLGNVIVFDDGASATYSVGIIPQCDNAIIRNNTIVVKSGTLNDGFEHTSTGFTGIQCTDNVILADGGTITRGIRYRPAGVTEARNIVRGATTPFYNSATSSSTSAGTGSSTSDPLLGGSFAPQAGSPALTGGGAIAVAFNDPDGIGSGTAGPYRGAYQTIDGGGESVQRTFALAVYAPPVVTTTTVPNATQNAAYFQALAASGTGPFVWSLPSGTPPAGITLSASGVFSGTATGGTGASTVTVRATGPSGAFDDQVLTLTVVASGTGPGITTTSLPSGTVGVAYDQAIVVTGTSPAVSIVGALHAGLSFNPSTLRISGTPTDARTLDFDVVATNATGTVTRRLSLTINPAAVAGAPITGGWGQFLQR